MLAGFTPAKPTARQVNADPNKDTNQALVDALTAAVSPTICRRPSGVTAESRAGYGFYAKPPMPRPSKSSWRAFTSPFTSHSAVRPRRQRWAARHTSPAACLPPAYAATRQRICDISRPPRLVLAGGVDARDADTPSGLSQLGLSGAPGRGIVWSGRKERLDYLVHAGLKFSDLERLLQKRAGGLTPHRVVGFSIPPSRVHGHFRAIEASMKRCGYETGILIDRPERRGCQDIDQSLLISRLYRKHVDQNDG